MGERRVVKVERGRLGEEGYMRCGVAQWRGLTKDGERSNCAVARIQPFVVSTIVLSGILRSSESLYSAGPGNMIPRCLTSRASISNTSCHSVRRRSPGPAYRHDMEPIVPGHCRVAVSMVSGVGAGRETVKGCFRMHHE